MNKKSQQAGKDAIGNSSLRPRTASNSRQLEASIMNEDAGYDDPPIPYVPLPDDRTRHTNMSWRKAISTPRPHEADVPTPAKTDGIIVLVGLVLGAGLGALLAYLLKGDIGLWAFVGAGLGIVTGLAIYSNWNENGSLMLGEVLPMALPDMFSCCTFSIILMLASVAIIGGFVLTHILLLS